MEPLTLEERGERPVRVLVVASWFPDLDDTSKGRFVADQVLALSSVGATPAVLSFDPLRSSGAHAERREQIAVARRSIAAAVRAHPDELFSARAWAVAGEVPVARVPIVQAGDALEGPLHRLEARSALVEPLTAAFGSWRPDIVHAHTIYPDGAVAARLADRLACPLVVTEHAHFLDSLAEAPEVAREIAATVERASAVVCVGGGLAATLRRLAPDAGPRIRVLPNAVDFAAFTPAPLDERTPDQLLFVGYRSEVKGVDTLLRAVALARAVRPTIRLRMIGKAPNAALDERWRRLATGLGIADAVTFELAALRPGVAAAMQTASVLVHASRHETFGVVPVEGLAAGLPVIATATEGVSETFRLVGGPDGRAVGRLVPVEDPEALAAAILDVLQHRARFDPAALRAAVEPHFSFDAVGRRLLELYAEVLAAGAPARNGSAAAARGELLAGDGPRTALLVGLDRLRVARALRGLPDEALRALSLVTAAVDQGGALPPAIGALTLVDTDATFRAAIAATGGFLRGLSSPRRVARLVRHPLGPLHRRRLRARRPAMQEAAAVAALRVVATGEVDVVAFDAADLGALARAGVDPTRILPGTTRWLADRAASRGSAAEHAEPTG